MHLDTIDNELGTIRQAEPPQNTCDAREGFDEPGGNLDAAVTEAGTYEEIDSDPEPLGLLSFWSTQPEDCVNESDDKYTQDRDFEP